jgi:long-chain acyl-CoA synthetase
MVVADTIPARFFERTRTAQSAPAYARKHGDSWAMTDWKTFGDEVRRAACALLAIAGPGKNVAILGFNRPEWVILDMACMAIGGAPAGIYTTCSPEEVRYIADHCEAPVVLVENEAQWKKIAETRDRLPHLRRVVMMRGATVPDDPLVVSWETFIGEGAATDPALVDEHVRKLSPDAMATLIYTSGTTGPPKAVMLTHRNLAWTATVLARQVVGSELSDRVLSYLPLSHIAEQMVSIHGSVEGGYCVYFAESIDKVADNLKEVRPTIFFGVPRIWEKMDSAIGQKLAAATGARKRLVEWSSRVGIAYLKASGAGGRVGPLLSLQYSIANRLVFRKLRTAIGFDAARFCVSGAAPIAPEVLVRFAGLGLPIYEVYGQSEGSGPTSINAPGACVLGTVGRALPGVTVKIADDGEILVHGPNVFAGYYKEPEATAETLEEGWLRSGDLGRVDDSGYLHITGRKKEIIITAGGKNVSPKNIEAALKEHPLVGEAVVIGDRRKYLVALLTLDPEAAVARAAALGVSVETLCANESVLRELELAVEQVNRDLARVEQIKRFRILPRPFGIDTGELTPTLKVKRRVVGQLWAKEIESLYEE